MSGSNGTAVAADRALVDAVTAFLYDESAALDEHRPQDWLDLLTEDFEYLVPLVEIYEDPARSPYHPTTFLDHESKGGLALKLLRAASDYAWAQRPTGFLRHFVGNVRVMGTAERPDDVVVRSNVLVTWTRDPEPTRQMSAGRLDHVRRSDDGFRLSRRTVFLDTAHPHAAQLWVVY